MSDREALMRAVLLHPGEDAPKLALADWYEEHGNPEEKGRAAFIREPGPTNANLSSRRRLPARTWKAWAGPLIPHSLFPRKRLVAMGAHPNDAVSDDGENYASWPVRFGILFGSGHYYAVRHGFVVAVAAKLRRLSQSLPALVAVQPIHEIAHCSVFLEFAQFCIDPAGRELAQYPSRRRVIRSRANKIPKGVFRRLTPEPVQTIVPCDLACVYESLTAAREDLSRAWVNWARHEAGLPELP